MQRSRAPFRLFMIDPGESEVVQQDGQEVAVFNVEGRLYAVGNRCPHRSGPLNKGKVERVKVPGTDVSEEEVLAVRCPIHGWLFELATGRCLTRPGASVSTYEVTCEGETVCLGQAKGQAAGPTVSGEVK